MCVRGRRGGPEPSYYTLLTLSQLNIYNALSVELFRQDLINKLREAKKELDKLEAQNKKSFIQEKVEKLRAERNSAKPSKFFKATSPASVFPNQQVSSVTYTNAS